MRLIKASSLLIILLSFTITIAQTDDPSLLTLERIFSSSEFSGERFGPARWLKDGSGYTTLERADGGGREIVGYDPGAESFSFIEVFRWNPATDTFDFTGNMNSYLLEHKIAPKRGIPSNKVRKMYKELEKKARILKKIHDSGITGFYDLFAVLSRMEGEGVV